MKALFLRFSQRLATIETAMFWLFCLGMLWPVWSAPGIYTYDGPAHMYNARQMWEMLFQGNTWLQQYYAFTPGIDNWLLHGSLMLLQAVFGSVLAEKIALSIYVLIFVYGFRQWMLYMQQKALSWWVLLLLYFFNLLMGQYSFAMSVALFPFFMLQWQQYGESRSTKRLIYAAIFLFLLYLTHVVSFGVAGLSAGVILLLSQQPMAVKTRQLFTLALISLPGLLLTAWFMRQNAGSSEMLWLPLGERWQALLDSRVLIVYSYTEDVGWTRLFSGLLALLMLMGSWVNRHRLAKSAGWWVLWLLVLSLYMFAPDQAAGGGFIQTRLQILLLVLAMPLLASFQKMDRIYRFSVPLLLFLVIRLGAIHYQTHLSLAEYRTDWEQAAALIPPEKTLVTFNYSPLWIQHHIHLLIGQDKAVVHTANYEADNQYFPLRWVKSYPLSAWINYWSPNSSLFPCTVPEEVNTAFLPDYVVVFFEEEGRKAGCTGLVEVLLSSYYSKSPVFSTEKLAVYALK